MNLAEFHELKDQAVYPTSGFVLVLLKNPLWGVTRNFHGLTKLFAMSILVASTPLAWFCQWAIALLLLLIRLVRFRDNQAVNLGLLFILAAVSSCGTLLLVQSNLLVGYLEAARFIALAALHIFGINGGGLHG